MSSAVFFLLLAVALMAVGSLVVWMSHRQPPPSDRDSVDQFSRNREALDPTRPERPRRSSSGR